MAVDIVTAIVATAVIVAAGSAIEWCVNRAVSLWGKHKAIMPETLKAELSDTDREMAEKTQLLMREMFGGDIAQKFRAATNFERINMTHDFASRLSQLYGVDAHVDVFSKEPNENGTVTFGLAAGGQMAFNVYLLDVSGNHENFDLVVHKMLEAIIHEMRHLVQDQAIVQPGFWNVDEERRMLWTSNQVNYVRYEADVQRYINQPVEADARTFAEEAMKGVVM